MGNGQRWKSGFLGALLGLLALALAGAAQDRAAQTPAQSVQAARGLPSADAIIAHYAAARGGLERLLAVRSIIYRGVYREGSLRMPRAAMALMRPYLKLVGDPEHSDPEFAEGYDGSAWEFYGDPGVVLRTVGAASAAGRHATSIEGPLLDRAATGATATVQGVEDVDGRLAYRLLVHMRDGFEQEELIDSGSWLLIAERKAAPIHAFGKRVASEERLGDYRAVEGIRFAFARREVEIATGRVLNEMTWTSITLNHQLDPKSFSPPPFERTAEQRFLEQLYEERDDAAAVAWTCYDFRRAHPATDMRAGIEVIGYQMAKMGALPAAIELLTANEKAHPRSASAAFALGRALVAAGDPGRGRAAFERALALDPKFERAATALAELR